jgi:hypothetical protein
MCHSLAYALAFTTSRLATAFNSDRRELRIGGITARLIRAVLNRPQRNFFMMPPEQKTASS